MIKIQIVNVLKIKKECRFGAFLNVVWQIAIGASVIQAARETDHLFRLYCWL